MRFFWLLLMFCLLSPPLKAQEKVTVVALQGSRLALLVDQVLTEAYARLGLRLETVYTTGQRSLEMAVKGEVDGAQLRVADLARKYPQLLLVPVPVYVTRLRAYVTDPQIRIKNWRSLDPYVVGTPRGYTAIERNVAAEKHWSLASYDQIFKMLNDHRLEVAITDEFNGRMTIRELGLKGIIALEPPLGEIKFYHLVHKKRADLWPKIGQVMKQMEQEGRIAQIWRDYEARSVDREVE